MKRTETQSEIIAYLESITRQLRYDKLSAFTASSIADKVSVSRNLASQYLNDYVRTGDVVKAGVRPVYFFHRRALERFLQAKLPDAVFASLQDLFKHGLEGRFRDFQKAIGCDRSLGPVIEQCKAALCYPQHGLPLLLVGESGVGKTYLAHLAFEYGKNAGVIDSAARLQEIDCSTWAGDSAGFTKLCQNIQSLGFAANEPVGMVLFIGVESLQPTALDSLIGLVGRAQSADAQMSRCRIVMTANLVSDSSLLKKLMRRTPIIAQVPALRDRTSEERELLALSFLRSEGRRLGVDVHISRIAFQCLVEADFEDNVAELKRCITNCCASAFLNHEDGFIDIHLYQLPTSVIAASSSVATTDDNALIDITHGADDADADASIKLFSSLFEACAAYEQGDIDSEALDKECVQLVHAYEDDVLFGNTFNMAKASAYELVLAPLVDDANVSHGVLLSRKIVRLLARQLCVQQWTGAKLSAWRVAHLKDAEGLLATVQGHSGFASAIADQIRAKVAKTLGIELDTFSSILLLACVRDQVATQSGRRALGIVLSHGYSTATSIADTANRILHARVYEAIDMPYDQQIGDIVGSLQQIVDQFRYCREIAILVDMGSLEEIYTSLRGLSSATIVVANNVSTGLAVEVGTYLLNGGDLGQGLAETVDVCRPSYRLIEPKVQADAVIFVSESGVDAAEKIRLLIEQSLPESFPAATLSRDYLQLAKNGAQDDAFTRFAVCAIIGTSDPHVTEVPYISLESIIAGDGLGLMMSVFGRWLDASALEEFTRRLIKKMTLENVIRSITILNPEVLFNEIESAVIQLQNLLDKRVEGNVLIGLYVHLCCLVERLVTRTPIESYADIDMFEREHRDFLEAFRQSFSGIARHYRIEVPTSEAAYVFDYLDERRPSSGDAGVMLSEDE